jgi:hypothetical protein
MNGKSETMAIFESYKQLLEEQNNDANNPSFIANKLLAVIFNKKNMYGVSPEAIDKLEQFLQSNEFETAWNNFKPAPMKMQSTPVEGDASAVNMGKGGVLEVQPDGQYPQ